MCSSDLFGLGWCLPPPSPLTNAPAGFRYCHYETITTPGLNKDRPYTSGASRPPDFHDQPAHKNHEYAKSAATRLSAQLWAAFLRDLPPVHAASPAPPPTLVVQMAPAVVVCGEDTRAIVAARVGQAPVAGTVGIGSDSFPTNKYFVHAFLRRRYEGVLTPEPVTVSVPGYPVAVASYRCAATPP